MSDPRISSTSPRTLEPVTTEPEPTSCTPPLDADAARRAELAHAESRLQSLVDSPVQTRDVLRQQWIDRREALKHEKPLTSDGNDKAIVGLAGGIVAGGGSAVVGVGHTILGIAEHLIAHTAFEHVLELGEHLLENHSTEPHTQAPVPPPATNGVRG